MNQQTQLINNDWMMECVRIVVHVFLLACAMLAVAGIVALLEGSIYIFVHMVFIVSALMMGTAFTIKSIQHRFKLIKMYTHMVSVVDKALLLVMGPTYRDKSMTDKQVAHLLSEEAPVTALADALSIRVGAVDAVNTAHRMLLGLLSNNIQRALKDTSLDAAQRQALLHHCVEVINTHLKGLSFDEKDPPVR